MTRWQKRLDKPPPVDYYLNNLIILSIYSYQKLRCKGERVMPRKNQKGTFCSPSDSKMSCCKVESIIGIDERGQMVLPKDLREKANMSVGTKEERSAVSI